MFASLYSPRIDSPQTKDAGIVGDGVVGYLLGLMVGDGVGLFDGNKLGGFDGDTLGAKDGFDGA